MIRVPTQGRYALRAMIDIGLHQDRGPVLRQDIADRQEISANYVAQIFRKLTAAELLLGIKGPGGGYKLAKPCEEIRASDILQAIEGPIALVHCVMNEGDEAPCERTVHCATHRMWSRLSLRMSDYLDSITLKDLMDESIDLDPHHAD